MNIWKKSANPIQVKPEETISVYELAIKWKCRKHMEVIYKALRDGMPCTVVNGENRFYYKKCCDWNLHGWFDALTSHQKASIRKQFKEG